MKSPFSDFSNQISRIYCEIFLICDFWKRRHILAAKLVNFSVFEFTFVISEFQNSWSFNYLFSVSKMLVFRNRILHVDFWKRKSKLVQGEILITWFLESEIGLTANLADPLDSGSSGPYLSPGRGHCVVFLGKTLTPCFSLSRNINLMLGVTLQWNSILSRGSRNTPSRFLLFKTW